jgi:hypothetical protein
MDKKFEMNRLWIILLIIIPVFQGCGLFTGGSIDEYKYRITPGEVVVSLNSENTPSDLNEFLSEFDMSWDRYLGNGYVIKVTVGEEKIWVPFLKNQVMVRDAQLNKFGFNYQITAIDDMPKIENGLLHVLINYSGCNSGHDFTVEYERTEESSYEIWLYKETPDQMCRAYFSDYRSFELPSDILNANQILMRSPVDEFIMIRCPRCN